MLDRARSARFVQKLNWRRVGGSAAALGVLIAAPSAPFVVELVGSYALTGTVAFIVVLGLALVAGRLLWDGYDLVAVAVVLLAAGFLAVLTAISTFFAAFAISISQSLCGADGSSTPTAATVTMIASYLLIGLWGFQTPRRLLWAWPLAIVVGFALSLGVTAVLPSGHGSCET